MKQNWLVIAAGAILLTGLILVAIAILTRQSSEAAWVLLGAMVGASAAGFFQYGISEADRKHSMRTAALAERLKAHQDAYTLWRELRNPGLRDEDVASLFHRCESWWASHCLYLTADAMKAFSVAYQALLQYIEFRKQGDSNAARPYREDIWRAGNIILEGVYLPPVAEPSSIPEKDKPHKA